MATCVLFSTAHNAAIAATIVFPEPTSPCNNRIIGCGFFKSFLNSSATRFCARVNSNGNKDNNACNFPVSWLKAIAACVVKYSRRLIIAKRCANNSSNTKRRCAGCCAWVNVKKSSFLEGRCNVIIACFNVGNFKRSSIAFGKSSSISAPWFSKKSACSLNWNQERCDNPSVVG